MHPRDTTSSYFVDTLLDSSHNGWGNIEAFGKVVWLGDPGQQGRLALAQWRARSQRDRRRRASRNGVILAIPRIRSLLPRATARRRSSRDRRRTSWWVLISSGRSSFATRSRSDNVFVGLHPGHNPFADRRREFFAQRKLGTTVRDRVHAALSARPILRDRRAISVPSWLRRIRTRARRPSLSMRTPVTLDASTLDAGSELTEHRLGFGVVYSAVDAYTRNRRASRWK